MADAENNGAAPVVAQSHGLWRMCWHIAVLLKKNYYVYAARKYTTIVQLLLPATFIFLMLCLSFIFKGGGANSHPSARRVAAVGRCGAPGCYTLVYAPKAGSNQTVDAVVALFLEEAGLAAVDTLSLDCLGGSAIGCSLAVSRWLVAHPQGARMGIAFDAVTTAGSSNGTWRHKYFANDTEPGQLATYQRVMDKAIFTYLAQPSGFNLDISVRLYPTLSDGFDGQTAILSYAGVLFFYIAIVSQFIVLLGNLVYEKEQNLRLGMATMGMQQSSFWISWTITAMLVNAVAILLLIAMGAACQFDIILNANFFAVFLSFWMFGMAMAAMAFALSTVLAHTRSATTAGFLFIVAGIILLSFFSTPSALYSWFDPATTSGPRTILSVLYPPFSFAKCYHDITRLASKVTDVQGNLVAGVGYTWADISTFRVNVTTTDLGAIDFAPPPTGQALLWLLWNFGFYLALALYLDSVLPGNQGIYRPPWFLFTPAFWGCGAKPRVTPPEEAYLATLDSDVAEEARRLFRAAEPGGSAITVMNLVKEYGVCARHRAVQGVSFAIEEGGLFALLGHNGAGKTTTISMMSGLFPSTEGETFLCGLPISQSLDQIRHKVGICPQHDILWDTLTGRQHLTIFAHFRGIWNPTAEVERLLAQVGLTTAGGDATRTYSGGMKRRLSVAIANIGDPKVMILDEPTTGMDPHSRRQVWQLIQRLKPGRAILLTTHSMEEADALADRIGIMARGQLRCLGPSLALKRKFGKGYQIKAVSPPTRASELQRLIAQTLPQAALVTNNGGSHIYSLAADCAAALSDLIRTFETAAKVEAEHRLVTDWGISQTTLEDVYMEIGRQFHDAEPAHPPQGAYSVSGTSARVQPMSPVAGAGSTADRIGRLYSPPDGALQSHPWRALFRKNATFQRHQPCTLCCTLAFPIIIIVFVLVLQVLVDRLKKSTDDTSTFYQAVDLSSPCAFVGYASYSDTATAAQGVQPSVAGPLPTPATDDERAEIAGLAGSSCRLTEQAAAWVYLSGAGPLGLGLDPSGGGQADVAAPGTTGSLLATLALGGRNATPPPSGLKAPGFDNATLRFQNRAGKGWFPYAAHQDDVRAVDDALTQALVATRSTAAKVGVGRKGGSKDDQSAGAGKMDFAPLPAAAYELAQANTSGLAYTVRVNNGSDWFLNPAGLLGSGLSQYTLAQSSLIAMLHATWLRNLTGVRLVAEAVAMPWRKDASSSDLMEQLGAIFYPIVFIFPIPVFLFHIVYEKEFRIREMCKLNAMQMRHYWVVNCVVDYLIYIVMSAIFLIFLRILNVRWIRETNLLYIVLLLGGEGVGCLALAILISVFTSRTMVASVMGFFFVLVTWIGGFIIEMVVWTDGTAPNPIYLLIPPFAFQHGLAKSLDACSNAGCFKLSDIGQGAPLRAIVYLWVTSPVWGLLALYLDRVLPSRYGIRAPLCFCLPCLGRKKAAAPDGMAMQVLDRVEGELCDSDVEAEQVRVDRGEYNSSAKKAVLIRRLRKRYGDRFGPVAVHHLSLSMDSTGCFGLLGPNGAGKTTTISILSGMYGPTSGTALVNGFDIGTQMQQVQLSLGLCPQHDILWHKHLHCEDHLLFYARLKGIPPHAEKEHVKYWLNKVGLLHKAKAFPSKMSGGEQRRLSIAISLVGNPKVVLLDEPTTGLDPTHRREIWDLVQDAKAGRCVVLTTHSMEEAEVLSDTIGIMALGRLRCLGSPLHLKNKYGKGFRLSVSFSEGQRAEVVDFVLGVAPTARHVGLATKGTANFELDVGGDASIAAVFERMAAEGPRHGVVDWGVSQTSMEDVFLNIVNLAESAGPPVAT